MKKYLFSILILFLITSAAFSQSLDEAKRLLKLANTYINAENFDKANENYFKAKEIIARYHGWEANYWDAAADETLGNLYLKSGTPSLAQISYETALKKYKKLIRSKEGSQDALEELLNRSKGLEQATFSLEYQKAKVVSLDNTKKATENLQLPQGVESFSCNNCKLKEFPYQALKSPKIKTLVLSNNRIKEFSVPQNNSLEYLDLSNNKLKVINGSLKDLSRLNYLDISGNSFKSIPVGLTELKGLKVLKMTDNNIPFSMIKNLIQSMPNTLIIHDNYVKEATEEEEGIFPGE